MGLKSGLANMLAPNLERAVSEALDSLNEKIAGINSTVESAVSKENLQKIIRSYLEGSEFQEIVRQAVFQHYSDLMKKTADSRFVILENDTALAKYHQEFDGHIVGPIGTVRMEIPDSILFERLQTAAKKFSGNLAVINYRGPSEFAFNWHNISASIYFSPRLTDPLLTVPNNNP